MPFEYADKSIGYYSPGKASNFSDNTRSPNELYTEILLFRVVFTFGSI